MDDGRIGDEMTLEGIAKRLDALSSEISTQISSQISAEIGSVRADIKSLDRKFQSLDGKFQSLDGKFQSLDGKFQSLDGKLTALDHKMTIEFEETRRVVNLGFENTQMLREEVGRQFDEANRAHADHKTLLEAAVVSLHRDMKRPRRPGRPR